MHFKQCTYIHLFLQNMKLWRKNMKQKMTVCHSARNFRARLGTCLKNGHGCSENALVPPLLLFTIFFPFKKERTQNMNALTSWNDRHTKHKNHRCKEVKEFNCKKTAKCFNLWLINWYLKPLLSHLFLENKEKLKYSKWSLDYFIYFLIGQDRW